MVGRTFRYRIAYAQNSKRLRPETLQGVFYEEQLQTVRGPDVYPFPVLYENQVKELSWSGEVDLKNSTVGSL